MQGVGRRCGSRCLGARLARHSGKQRVQPRMHSPCIDMCNYTVHSVNMIQTDFARQRFQTRLAPAGVAPSVAHDGTPPGLVRPLVEDERL